jgi:hypothetical protein
MALTDLRSDAFLQADRDNSYLLNAESFQCGMRNAEIRKVGGWLSIGGMRVKPVGQSGLGPVSEESLDRGLRRKQNVVVYLIVEDPAETEQGAGSASLPETESPPEAMRIGGWLILLILSLGLFTPARLFRAVESMTKAFPLSHQGITPLARSGINMFCILCWGMILISWYCAYVLGFKRRGAVTVAKRGIVAIAVLFWMANLGFVFMFAWGMQVPMRPILEPLAEDCVSATVWLAIWYAYLARSKRVKATYLEGG